MRFFENPSPFARELQQLLINSRLSTWGVLFIALGLVLMIPATKSPANLQNTDNTQGFGNAHSIPGNITSPVGSKAQDLAGGQEDGGKVNNQTGYTNATGNSSSTAHSEDALRHPLPVAPLLRLSVTPSVVDVTKASATVVITSADGTPIAAPTINAGNDLIATIADQSPPIDFPGGVYRQKSWTATIYRINYSSSGDTYVTFSVPGGASGGVRVTWSPAPQFTMTAGTVTRTAEDDSTITYAMHFTLQPNNPYFGHPEITMRIIDTPQCINTSSLTKVVTYDGTNDYALDCMIQKAPVWQPDSGSPPPPAAGSLNITVEAYGNLPDGSFIKGPGNIYFNTPAPYNQ